MHVAVDQAGHHRAARGVKHGVGLGLVLRRIERGDFAVLDAGCF